MWCRMNRMNKSPTRQSLQQKIKEVRPKHQRVGRRRQLLLPSLRRKRTTSEETLCLISLYKKHEDHFSDVFYKRKSIWEPDISREMHEVGYFPSPAHCENRLLLLSSSFRKFVQQEQVWKVAFSFLFRIVVFFFLCSQIPIILNILILSISFWKSPKKPTLKLCF